MVYCGHFINIKLYYDDLCRLQNYIILLCEYRVSVRVMTTTIIYSTKVLLLL